MACKGVTEPTTEERGKKDFLVFREGKLEVVKGTATKKEIDLTAFFYEVNKCLLQEFELSASEEIVLSAGNIASAIGEVRFIGILVDYPEGTLTANEYIHFVYPNTETTSPPTSGPQMNIGRVMILSGSTTANKGWDLSDSGSPKFGGLKITNPQTFAVTVKVLLVN